MSGQQFLELRAALLSGFISETDFSYLLTLCCDKDLAALSPAFRSNSWSLIDNFQFVLDRASKQGWVRALLTAAVAENPGNPLLAEYSRKFGHQEALPLDELCTALVHSFPSLASFEQLLSFGLDRSLRGMRMENMVMDVMERAEQEGWLADLAAGAYELRPGNPQVRSIYFQLFPDRVLAQILSDRFDRQTASLMLRKIGRRMADIPRTGDEAHLFRDLASSARVEGWIAEFVRALLDDNPAVEELQLLMAELPKLPELQPAKGLSGKQLALLHAAMMSVFEIEGLKRFLRFRLEKNLDELSSGGKRQDVIFDVLSAAEKEGWTRKLMRASLEEFPSQDNYRRMIESVEGELA
jgi:hypothetical protein